MKEYEVMRLSGHSYFFTMHKFYIAVADDLIDRVRQATEKALGNNLARSTYSAKKRKKAGKHMCLSDLTLT